LFNESIKENILNAKPDATDDEIYSALKSALAYDFVMEMSEGINTNVGSVGSKLSGGQKQRIAIARALIKKPTLLILDEATSALDSKSEKEVQGAIEKINKEMKITTVVIAHRLPTLSNAKKIIILEDGKVKDEVTYEKLCEMKGISYKLNLLDEHVEGKSILIIFR
jgi:ABC-type multidrug transport system fused ATPase/permease subunit